jgi:hypothetical protein
MRRELSWVHDAGRTVGCYGRLRANGLWITDAYDLCALPDWADARRCQTALDSKAARDRHPFWLLAGPLGRFEWATIMIKGSKA